MSASESTNPFDVDRVWFRCGCLAMGKHVPRPDVPRFAGPDFITPAVLVDAFMGVCARHRQQAQPIPGPLAIFRRVVPGRSDQLFDVSGEPLERLEMYDLKTARPAGSARAR